MHVRACIIPCIKHPVFICQKNCCRGWYYYRLTTSGYYFKHGTTTCKTDTNSTAMQPCFVVMAWHLPEGVTAQGLDLRLEVLLCENDTSARSRVQVKRKREDPLPTAYDTGCLSQLSTAPFCIARPCRTEHFPLPRSLQRLNCARSSTKMMGLQHLLGWRRTQPSRMIIPTSDEDGEEELFLPSEPHEKRRFEETRAEALPWMISTFTLGACLLVLLLLAYPASGGQSYEVGYATEMREFLPTKCTLNTTYLVGWAAD